MASTILNFIVENYLSNFIEIDPSQTKTSLWSGEVQMSNVKIKKELFQTMNIPFLEVVHGYIGSIKIKMQMPMFYKYPIDVFIEKVFFHARQKDINEINKEEEIKNMEEYKLSTLLNEEILKSQINQINKEESAGMQKQIMSNLRIEINDVVFRYDDNVSYKKIPYSLGLILKQLSLISTKSDFKKLSNPAEVLKYEEINYKKICIDKLSLFWDCFNTEEELKFNNLIEKSYYHYINTQLKEYLGSQLDFYIYCLSEINKHSLNDKAHQYILHNIEMKLNATINDNINKNMKPEYIGELDFPSIVIDISLKQIETILKVLSYMGLSSLYHEGLAKDFYKKELSDEDKKIYIREYVVYFHKKYELKEKIEFPENLKKMEEGISLYQIQLMRAASLKKSDFFKEKTLLENKLKEQEGKFFWRNEKLIESLKKEINLLVQSEENYNQIQIDELENKNAKVQIDNLMNLPDNYLHFVGIFRMDKIKFILHEKVEKINSSWICEGKIIEIEFIKYFLKGEFYKKGMLIKMTLEDTLIKQDKIQNPNYSAILFGDVNTKGKILDIEFEMNPNLERSDMRFTMKAERGIYIICDLYVIQYIQYKVMKVLSTSINFTEIANYAKDSVSQYIQIEYAKNFLKGNYSHNNIYLDIVFNSPIIILPLNIFDNDNTSCIKLSLGKFIGTSILPPRMIKAIDYTKIKDEKLLFDVYKFDLQGGKISTTDNCTLDNGFNGKDNYLLKEFDMSIIIKVLIETKNPLPNIKILIGIPSFDFQIDEFQILFLIDYLGNMNIGNNKLSQETSADEKIQNEEKKEIENFMKNQMSGEIKEKITTEDANMKFVRKRMEEFDEKVKKMQKENRYHQFVKSYSQLCKNSNLLHPFEKMEKNKKTLLILLDFREFKFTIKKNYTDYTTEEYLIYDQKSFEIEYFIDDNGNMSVTLTIKDINLFDKDREEIYDNNKNTYNILDEGEDDENDKNIINTNINYKTKRYPKNYLIQKEFSCLIKSSFEKEEEGKMIKINPFDKKKKENSFIVIRYLYKVKIQDTLIEIIMNNLNIIISFDSLKRMYQFSMYYLDRYQKMIEDTNNKVPNQNNINPKNKKEYLNTLKEKQRKKNLNKDSVNSFTKGIKSDLQKKLNNYIEKLNNQKNENIFLDSWNKWKNILKEQKSGKILKRESIKNTMKVKFIMKKTNFKVPLYPQSKETPIVVFFFNMIYNQDWTNEYENLYTIPNKKIVETNYFVQDSKMNLVVNQLNLNVTFPSKINHPFLNSQKILNDLRLFINVSMSIIPKLKQSLIITKILLEPLLINLSVKQFIYIWDFYSLAMKFLYYDMPEKYIPLMKPEYLKTGIPKRQKLNLRQTLRKILVAKKLQKQLKNELRTIKKEQGEKIDNVNTNNFNSYIECKVKVPQINFIFYDSNDFRRMPLFNADFSNLIVEFISNSKSKDKQNMGNAIVEMITATELPIEEFNKNSLGMYLDVYFTFEANYHNTNISEFEPLIERFNSKVLMYQVASFMRNKCFVNINDMINFNISSNAVKSLNLFMLMYSENNDEMEKFKQSLKKQKSKSSENILPDKVLPKGNKIENKPLSKNPFFNLNRRRMIVNNEGAVISISNHTGVDVSFSFESNPQNIKVLKPNELMAFSKNDLIMAKGIEKGGFNKNINTMSVSILNSDTIHGINFNHNNACQYKLKVSKDSKIYTIYFSIKVKTQGVVKKIFFTSALSIYNNTIYDKIFFMINNKNIERNIIEIPKDRRRYIPISWFLCETPESEIRVKFGENGEEHLIFYHAVEMMIEPVNKKKEEENMKLKSKIIKQYENCNNLEKKDIIEKIKNEAKNLKCSKIVEIKDNNANPNSNNKMQYVCLDYYIFQSKSHSKIINSEYNKKNAYKRKDTLYSEKINLQNTELEFSYEYIIYIHPAITFFNSLPFDLDVSINDFIKFKLEKNKSENIYYINPENLNNKGMSIKLILNYYDKKYRSDYHIPIDDLSEIELSEEGNDLAEKKNFNMLKLPKEIELDSDIKYALKLIGFSCKSYNMTFYSDYIVNNRLPYPLWCLPCNKKGISGFKKDIIGNKQKELPKNSLNLITLPNDEDKFIIRSETSNWSNPFDINTIGVNGAITIDSQVESARKNILTKSKDIACLISKSQKYKKSTVIVFEQRFLLFNNLGFDIYFKQEKDVDILIQDKTEKELFYRDKEKIYRLGLKNSDDRLISYSQPFSADNVNDVDLLIKIGNKDLHKYKQFRNNIFMNNSKDNYILIRIINKTYDDGTFYLLIILPVFPFMEINNETEEPITIIETTDNKKDRTIIEPHIKRKKFPFVWKNTYEPKDNLDFEINGSTTNFSFSKLEKKIITVDIKSTGKKKYYKYKVYRKNKGMTRELKIVEIPENKAIENKFLDTVFFLKSKRPSSSSYVVNLNGIGFSIINNVPRELFYISLYDIKIQYLSNFLQTDYGTKTQTTENIELYLKNFQIDYCLNDSIKKIIFPTNQMTPAREAELEETGQNNVIEEFVPFLSLLVTRHNSKNDKKSESISYYKQIDLVIQEFNIIVEQYVLTCLLELLNEIMGYLDYSSKLDDIKKEKEEIEPILETKVEVPLEKLLKENEDLERMTINILMLSCLKFNITIRLDLSQLNLTSLPKSMKRILGSVGNTLTRITDGKLKFSEKIFINIYKNASDITWELIKHYKSQGIKQIYKILGSTDLIGNPVNFIEGLGTGFFDLVNEPRKGFLLGPKQFGKGILKGLGGLLSGVVGGAAGVIQRFSGTFYSATKTIMGQGREFVIEEEDEPTNIISGIGRGLYGGLKELATGITGIFMYPYKKYKEKKTVTSLVKAIGKGFLGLIISPFAAAFKFIYSVAAGTKNTVNIIAGKKVLVTTRFRHPRVMIGGDEPIHRYDSTLAEAKEILFRLLEIETDYIFYAKYFVSGDKGFGNKIKDDIYKMCMVIITDTLILVIYNSTKVIFKLEINKINKCCVHYIDNKYILAFEINDKSIKGFKFEKDYAKIACEIYDMFYKIDEIKNIKAVYTLSRPDLRNKDKKEEEEEQKENEEEKLDKSSYEKTLEDNDSVLTFDNDKNIINEKNKISDIRSSNMKNINININEIKTNSSRNQMIPKNSDIYLDVKDYK